MSFHIFNYQFQLFYCCIIFNCIAFHTYYRNIINDISFSVVDAVQRRARRSSVFTFSEPWHRIVKCFVTAYTHFWRIISKSEKGLIECESFILRTRSGRFYDRNNAILRNTKTYAFPFIDIFTSFWMCSSISFFVLMRLVDIFLSPFSFNKYQPFSIFRDPRQTFVFVVIIPLLTLLSAFLSIVSVMLSTISTAFFNIILSPYLLAFSFTFFIFLLVFAVVSSSFLWVFDGHTLKDKLSVSRTPDMRLNLC